MSSRCQQAERGVAADALIKDKLSLLTPNSGAEEPATDAQDGDNLILANSPTPHSNKTNKEHQLEGYLEPKARTRTRLKRQGDLLDKSREQGFASIEIFDYFICQYFGHCLLKATDKCITPTTTLGLVMRLVCVVMQYPQPALWFGLE